MRTYKKISKEYLPYFGKADIYFNNKFIGKTRVYKDLELSISETWQDFTTDHLGGNIIESKLSAITIQSSLELILNEDNQVEFIESVSKKPYIDKIETYISTNNLGRSSKKGELKIIPLDPTKEQITIYECILKTNQSLGLNVSNDKVINIEFIALPKYENGEYKLIKFGEEEFLRETLTNLSVIDFGIKSGVYELNKEIILGLSPSFTIPNGKNIATGYNKDNGLFNLTDVHSYTGYTSYQTRLAMSPSANRFLMMCGNDIYLFSIVNDTVSQLDTENLGDNEYINFNDNLCYVNDTNAIVIINNPLSLNDIVGYYLTIGATTITTQSIGQLESQGSNHDFTFRVADDAVAWLKVFNNQLNISTVEYYNPSFENLIRVKPDTEVILDSTIYDNYSAIKFDSAIFAIGYNENTVKYYYIYSDKNEHSLNSFDFIDLELEENQIIKEINLTYINSNYFALNYIIEDGKDIKFKILKTKLYKFRQSVIEVDLDKEYTITSNSNINSISSQYLEYTGIDKRLILIYNELNNINKYEIEI